MLNLKQYKDSVVGTFVIIIAFCLVCSVLVSSAVVALGPFKEAALANDRQVSILRVSGIDAGEAVAQTYADHIEAQLIDVETGLLVPEMQDQADGYNFQSLSRKPETSVAIPPEEDVAGIRMRAKYMPVYFVKDDEGTVNRIILPFYGAALWSTAYGYVALSTDGNTILGLTFYSHGETPGLGGEIDNPRWQALWVDKKFDNENGEYAFVIKKNAAKEGDAASYEVDSLSGATLTTRGIDNAVRYWFGNAYKPFLENVRKGEIIK